MKYHITGSLVTYENSFEAVKKVVDSFLSTSLSVKLQIIDNSSKDILRGRFRDHRCEYFFNNHNLGFGKAHNKSINSISDEAEFHLVLNPDISFPPGTLEELYRFMEMNPDVGLVLPKVLNLQSQVQRVCKRLPTPADLIVRRFGTGLLQKWFGKRLGYYEMMDKDYDACFEVPYLSGCFMFFRVEALKKIALFDERFFLYMEDVDISRRMFKHYKNVYYPHVHIFHGHARESYKLNKYLFAHITSAIKYFNKWGWFLDRERTSINTSV